MGRRGAPGQRRKSFQKLACPRLLTRQRSRCHERRHAHSGRARMLLRTLSFRVKRSHSTDEVARRREAADPPVATRPFSGVAVEKHGARQGAAISNIRLDAVDHVHGLVQNAVRVSVDKGLGVIKKPDTHFHHVVGYRARLQRFVSRLQAEA